MFSKSTILFVLKGIQIKLNTFPLKIDLVLDHIDLYLFDNNCITKSIKPEYHILSFDNDKKISFYCKFN